MAATLKGSLHAEDEILHAPLVGVAHANLLAQILHGQLDVAEGDGLEVVGIVLPHGEPCISFDSGFVGGALFNLGECGSLSFGIEGGLAPPCVNFQISQSQGILHRLFVEI